MSKQIELRNFASLSEVEKTSEGLFVRGIVNKPGFYSHPMTGRNGKKFVERVMPGAFKQAIERAETRAENIDFLAEHNKDKILANTLGKTLKLEETTDGLLMEARISETSYGKDYHVLIKDGLIPAMSFGMYVLKDKWSVENGINKRSITEIALTEVSAVKQGAYQDGAIQTRNLEDVVDIDVPENIEQRSFTTMNIKQLGETKQSLLKEAKQLLDVGEVENRSLNDEESLRQAILVNDIESVNEQIKEYESKNKTKKEVRNMENTNQALEQETRALDQFIKGEYDGEELRDLTTKTTPGSLTIPTHLHNEIVRKMYEVAPLFGMTKNFTPVSGFLEILREKTIGTAGFVGEGESVALADFTMDKIRLDQKRVGTAIELSQHLINDSGIDVVGHVTDIMAKRTGHLLDRNILNGDKATQFEGLLKSVEVKDAVEEIAVDAITADELLDLYNSMNENYLGEAVFVVSRLVFNAIAKLKDGNGHYFLVSNFAETKPVYKLFGRPVLINDAMPGLIADARSVLFANFKAGYATMTKKELNLQEITDSNAALKGVRQFMLDGYMDGKVYNPEAIRFLKQAKA